MKINCLHASTCLPDYWGGHHLPHISVPVYSGMKAQELRNQLKGELMLDAVMGGTEEYLDENGIFTQEFTQAAKLAVDEMHVIDGPLFLGLSKQEEGDDSVYAYFILEVEQ